MKTWISLDQEQIEKFEEAIAFFQLTIDMDDDEFSQDCSTIVSAREAIKAMEIVKQLPALMEYFDESVETYRKKNPQYADGILTCMETIESNLGISVPGLEYGTYLEER